MSLPIIVVGGGGHAKVLIDMLQLEGKTILGIVEKQLFAPGHRMGQVPVVGDDETVLRYRSAEILLVNGIGSTALPGRRAEIYARFTELGYRFAAVRHPAAVIAADVQFGEGAQVMAGAVLQPGCCIGTNVIINTRASIDHDCHIQDHTHIAPGVTLSGEVQVGAGSHIGTGAVVIQGIKIGKNVVVGAGAVVVRDVPDGLTVMGVPARER